VGEDVENGGIHKPASNLVQLVLYTYPQILQSLLSDHRGVVLTTHPHLAPRLKKEYGCTSTPPLSFHGLFLSEL
jgi:hypothetical protein